MLCGSRWVIRDTSHVQFGQRILDLEVFDVEFGQFFAHLKGVLSVRLLVWCRVHGKVRVCPLQFRCMRWDQFTDHEHRQVSGHWDTLMELDHLFCAILGNRIDVHVGDSRIFSTRSDQGDCEFRLVAWLVEAGERPASVCGLELGGDHLVDLPTVRVRGGVESQIGPTHILGCKVHRDRVVRTLVWGGQKDTAQS